MQKDVFIISNHNYNKPNNAAISRILNYSKALAQKGSSTILLSFKLGTSLQTFTECSESIYILGLETRGSRFILRKLRKHCYFVYTLLYLIKIYFHIRAKRIKKPNSIIVFSHRIFDDLLILFFFKILLRVKTICEKNEIYYTIPSNLAIPNDLAGKMLHYFSLPFKLFSYYLNDLLVIFYDEVISISSNIYDWVRRFNSKVNIIPILCGDSLPISNINKEQDYFSIGYAGTLSIKKDGLVILINSIRLILNSGANVFLNLYGSGSKFDVEYLTGLVDELKLNDYIINRGVIENKSLLQELGNNDLLVLPRPNSWQAYFGFSTKLAEYLSTGLPVLATAVGDNPKYITDGVNGYILESLNEHTLCNKIKSIMKISEEERELVGREGKNTMLKYFHYSNYSTTLSKIT